MTVQLRDATVAIVGLGLMGGSLGLALAGYCRTRLGCDADEGVALAAERHGVIDSAETLESALAAADLLVLAMPVGGILELMPRLAGLVRPGTVVTDLGSTKRAVVEAMEALPDGIVAVGGHPMCGRERSGLAEADATLYQHATWVVVPTARTTPAARTLVEELVVAVGAHAIDLQADRHDAGAAVASHLNYVVAQALLGVLEASDEPAARTLAASGFRGATRLAAGSVAMWQDILETNADEVGSAIDRLVAELVDIRGRLDDPSGLTTRLEAGRSARHAFDTALKSATGRADTWRG